MRHVVLRVPDISCEHCERTVTRALGLVAGVHRVDVDIPAKQVRVAYDEASVDVGRLESILRDEDYPAASSEPGAAPEEGTGPAGAAGK
ncbi:MAG TPA: heavy-metal-associated domain-containing protein [bacterium]|nr:heavy-metal-associated domain-containing protein [bacterium]